MWRIVTVLGLLLCCAAAVAGPAEYRFQALVDRDQSANTGCDFESPAGTVHGKELRVYAETDRTRILRVVTEQCESGEWRQVGSDASARLLGLGQGRLGSDFVEWEIQRNRLADAQAIGLQLWGQNIDSGAYDFAGKGDGSDQSGLIGHPVEITDPANDSVGKDAGVDFISASTRDNGTAIAVRVEVNNIEADGLADHSKVLFIGNSLTYANYLPSMLSAVAAQAGKTLVTAEVNKGGLALEDHFRAGHAKVEIAKGYQLVILQQGPSANYESQVNLRRWSIRFDPLIRESGARPALYMVWPELARLSLFDAVGDSYSNAALAIDGMFIPGGEAWRASWRIDPALEFYSDDNFHPSPLGTYAIALSMFAEMFRQTPADLPATFSLANGTQIVLDPAQARAVQQGAWQAHLQYGRAGK